MRRHSNLHCVFILICLVALQPLAAQEPEIDPSNGALVIAGGAMRDPAIYTRFLELAGEKDAPIMVIPTAGGRETCGQYWRGLLPFKEAGATNCTVLHTTDKAVADSEDFVRPVGRVRKIKDDVKK